MEARMAAQQYPAVVLIRGEQPTALSLRMVVSPPARVMPEQWCAFRVGARVRDRNVSAFGL